MPSLFPRLCCAENIHSALEAYSDIYKSACSVLHGSSDGKPQVSGLHTTHTGSYKGPHIRLRYTVPDHLAPIDVSALAHCLTCRIVVQKLNGRGCDSNAQERLHLWAP